MVRIEKNQETGETKLIIEIKTHAPEEYVLNLKTSITELLCTSVEFTDSANYAYASVRFMQELDLGFEQLKKGLS
jgi:hypothetical protein